jgi:hypothetical protein
MRVRLMAYPIVATGILLSLQPVMAGPDALNLPQCYIETKPCGTPEQLQRQIHDCLEDPNLCHGEQRVRAVAEANPGHVSSVRTASTLDGAVPSSPGRGLRVHGPGEPQRKHRPHRAPDSVPAGETESASVVASEAALPLDRETRGLTDTMPADAGTVERRLGLRRTRSAGIDMRGTTPSPAAIVHALAPAQGPDQ